MLKDGGRHGSVTDGEVAEAGGIAAWVRPDAADLQALHTAGKQEASQKLRVALTEGMRLATVLRLAEQ